MMLLRAGGNLAGIIVAGSILAGLGYAAFPSWIEDEPFVTVHAEGIVAHASRGSAQDWRIKIRFPITKHRRCDQVRETAVIWRVGAGNVMSWDQEMRRQSVSVVPVAPGAVIMSFATPEALIAGQRYVIDVTAECMLCEEGEPEHCRVSGPVIAMPSQTVVAP